MAVGQFCVWTSQATKVRVEYHQEQQLGQRAQPRQKSFLRDPGPQAWVRAMDTFKSQMLYTHGK